MRHFGASQMAQRVGMLRVAGDLAGQTSRLKAMGSLRLLEKATSSRACLEVAILHLDGRLVTEAASSCNFAGSLGSCKGQR